MYEVQFIIGFVDSVAAFHFLCQSHYFSFSLSICYLGGSVCTQWFESFVVKLKSWAAAPSLLNVAVCEANVAVNLKVSS